MRAKDRHAAFTLIELVVVITILGILAAFAIPRFAKLETQARTSARDALAGSVRSGAALAHALWLAQSQPPSVTMEGKRVTMVNGYPNLATISATIVNLTGFGYDPATGTFTKTGAAASCTVTYAEAAANGSPSITTGVGC